MLEDKTENIRKYLSSHSYLNLAISYRDKPYASTMKYVAEEFSLYFAMFKRSHTANILLQNNFVACTIDDHNVEEFIQIVGEAVLMDSKEERKKAGNILKKIYSNIMFWMYSDDVLFYKLCPYRIKYTLGGKNYKSVKEFGESFELVIKNL